MRSPHVIAAGLMSIALAATAAAQTPQPFPRPGSSRPADPPPATQPARPPVVAPPATSPATPAGPPTEATLGVQIYPGAQFLQSFDAGRGQRYYLFGTNTPFTDIVNYYRTVLKQRGTSSTTSPRSTSSTSGSSARRRWRFRRA
jgi:hypothetical protein